MFAPILMEVLAGLVWKGQLPHAQYLEMVQRFASLRDYGLLPRGRERRDQKLNLAEISNAVLGLAASSPQWAGHVALIVSRLKPIGEGGTFFEGTETLNEAISKILLASGKPKNFRIELSCSEYWTNATGLATISLSGESRTSTIYFVPFQTRLANSAEFSEIATIESQRPRSDRRLVLTDRFFASLAEEITAATRAQPPSPDDGWEYDDEDLEIARLAKIGVKRGAHFLNIGVDNQVTWLKDPTSVKFDRYELILLPKTNKNVQSVHVDLTANRLSMSEAKSLIARFLSMLSWCSDNYAVMQSGWSGNPVPVPVPKRDLAFTTTSHWIFDRKIGSTVEIRRALALYREARNAHHNFLVGYAVVSYCKVIEVKNPQSNDVKNWIKKNLPTVQLDPQFARVAGAFDKTRGTVPPEEYLWTSCRNAVSHGAAKIKSDPDDADEIERLSIAADVFHILARLFIANDLGISESQYSGN